jgi:hypothetical protein
VLTEVGFRPGRDGFRFGNSWPAGAPATLAGLTVARVRGGLCGGMAYEAGTAWLAGRPLPDDRSAPRDGPLADRLWRAQLRSLDLPAGPPRYLRLQLPGADAARRAATLAALPRLRTALAAGRPALLGLVRAVGRDPRLLVKHHVVLGYGLDERADGTAEVAVYDPNHPGDDTVRVRVAADGTTSYTHPGLVAAVTALGVTLAGRP